MNRSPIIVYTCGTFDMFHIGHLKMLQYAKALGDKLIVAVNSDELVERHKGKKCIVPLEERMAIVSAIQYVDICIPQRERDKFKTWQKIGFDILVVGDDWFGKEYYMDLREKLEAVHVKSIFFPYTKNVSSTVRRQELITTEVVMSGVNGQNGTHAGILEHHLCQR